MAWRETFEPLRITATLRTGVVCDRWLPIDGVLLSQACRDQYGVQATTEPGGSTQPGSVRMPLEIRRHGTDNWYYAASWAQPQPWWLDEGVDYWNKRFDNALSDLVDFRGRRGKVTVEKGQYRAYHMPVRYYVADRIEWYVVGEQARIEALLTTCGWIGKKTAQGWGRVIDWCVEPWPEDWSVRRDGRLTRGVPVLDATEEERQRVMVYGVRPGYYKRSNQMPVAMP